MITTSNIKFVKGLESSINIIDILKEDIQTGLINKTFEFSINYLFNNFNCITNNRIKAIKKSYYTNNFKLLNSKLTDLKNELINLIHFYRIC